MDCKTARLLLELGLPRAQELEPDDAASLDEHLAACAECGSLAHEERRADAHLGAALRAVPVPPGLRDRLLDKLKAERKRRLRWRFHAPLAAAATLLLAVGVWWYNRPLPVIDLLAIHGEPLPGAAVQVEQFFDARGVRAVAPPQFNYKLLAAWHVVEFQGRSRVPHLLFQNGADYVEVYILSAKHFDFRTALQQGKADSGDYTVELLRHPEDPHVFYLVKYRGRTLLPFLVEAGRQTT